MNFNIKENNIRGLDISWIEEGEVNTESPLLLFLHGFPDNATAWSHQINYFKEEFHVIAPFVIGTNKGKIANKRRYRRDSYTHDIIEVLKKVDPKESRKIIIVAHDIGGVVADRLAELLDRVLSITFINSMGLTQFYNRRSNIFQIFKSYYIGLFQVPLIPEFAGNLLGKKAINKLYNMGKLNSDDEIRNSNKNVFKSLSHYKNYFKELIYSKDLTLRKILEVPTLYLFAESDSFLEIPSNKEIKKYFNDFEIRVIEGNHWIHRDRPDRVNQILDRFISKQLPKKNRNA